MKTKLLVLVFYFFSSFGLSQSLLETVKNSKGEKIDLFTDGTWKLSSDSYDKNSSKLVSIEISTDGGIDFKALFNGDDLVINDGKMQSIPQGATVTYSNHSSSEGKLTSLYSYPSSIDIIYDNSNGKVKNIYLHQQSLAFTYYTYGELEGKLKSISSYPDEVLIRYATYGVNKGKINSTIGSIRGINIKFKD